MHIDTTTLVYRWYQEVWNERRPQVLDELAVPDMVFNGVAGPNHIAQGLDTFRAIYAKLLSAFPDIKFTIEAAIRQGDTEAVRWSAAMTHAGDDLGMPATNKPVTLTGMAFARIAGGKLVEAWDNWDMMGLVNQIGVPPQAQIVAV
jgi:steroid delta-isomerase-like uncharacterized protein